ncbi:histidinol dehydrogenase [Paracrocinitomix mangrovi]|uniref:histidinol dehydrogenase n=1 Tax=Paracrocinitomix mangrovi TaxID=2862509 RepID=UPI001C8E2828|nr:histidinol dehydrogenase [Paracrocinitomix mangrovi]UKN02291.1 histidinol dehydrogenase [Paracrocinitomix mangrovi]
MKIISGKNQGEVFQQLKRPQLNQQDLNDLMNEIFTEIKEKGDAAIAKYVEKFDGYKAQNFLIDNKQIELAATKVSAEVKAAIQQAKSNIEKFHSAQIPSKIQVETTKGVMCWQEFRPIEKVGIYIPGGTAPLFSTVLMLAIPAKLAGCKELVLCTPASNIGGVAAEILYAAKICGVDKIYSIGGSQAIAALTIGTESIPSVDKIFGPGNQYVTAAKVKAQQMGVAIDMPAGPSELMVVADKNADPEFAAADLLSQAEHGEDSQVVAIVETVEFAEQLLEKVNNQLLLLSRKGIAEKALQNSKIIVLKTLEEVVEVVNYYAPEHLILMTEKNDAIIPLVLNAGSVFVGAYTPESAGDYASGTNHTLPTNGASRAYSGVNIDAFIKKITFQKISPSGIKNIGNTISVMADAEGLDAHKNAVEIRLKKLKV